MTPRWRARFFLFAVLAMVAGPGGAASLRARDEVWNPPRIVELGEGETLPEPKELEARGAKVGGILVRVYDVFDPSDPREDNWLYRAANTLHYKTRESAVVDQLTFRAGQPLKAQRLEESERILRERRYLFDAVVRIARYDPEANVADIEVSVRDVWTLNPGISYSNTGDRSRTSFEIEELNLFGRGQKLQIGWDDDVDRTSTSVQWLNHNLFGSRWELALNYADLSDGQTQSLALERPFYSLDARRASGGYWYDDQRVQTRYDLGQPVDAFEVDTLQYDLHYGWSKGLQDGWTRRWVAGLRYDEQAFAEAPGETPPETLPEYRKFIYPWIRREWVQDAYEQLRNHDMIGRREDVYLGTAWSASLGYAATGLGSSDNAWLLAGSLTSAREYRPGRQWSVGTATRGRLQSGDLRDAVLTAQARHYWQIGRRQTFYASMTGTLTEELDPDRQLLLGAEEGLRGYPLRYQTGTASALVTLEHRIYTDWYPFRFFHVGGAAFFDTGRTWGPTLSGEPPRGWLSDVGLGLRLGNSRSGLGSTIHVDFTYALNAVPGEDRFTISVDTKRGF
jgi:outer membrane protein assembly factor BamA